MRVGYVYEHDAADASVQSGRPYAILRELISRGWTVIPAFPLYPELGRSFSWKKMCYRAMGRIYRPDREAALLEELAARARRALVGQRIDCVFAPGSHAVARLDVGRPKIFCADATFRNVLDRYEGFTNCAAEYIRQGEEQDKLALKTSAAAIYGSHWAADVAVRHYGADPNKVHVIPFGANVAPPPRDKVQSMVTRRSMGTMNILFVGREWKRKGLPKVIETCRWIEAQGVRVQLDIVGAERYRGDQPGFARFHGYLNPSRAEGRSRLEELFAEAHFMFVPSVAENYGIVFCEAAAYAIPSITTDVGGIPAVVQHGVTGLTFAVSASPEVYGVAVLEIFVDRTRYEQMALRSYQEYEERLNWRAFGDRCVQVIQRACESWASQ